MESVFKIDWELVEEIRKNIRVNKRLDKYENVVLFPEKLERANRLLEGVKLPHEKDYEEK